MSTNEPQPLSLTTPVNPGINPAFELLNEALSNPQPTFAPAYRGSYNGENLTPRQKKAKLAKRRAVKKSRSINRR